MLCFNKLKIKISNLGYLLLFPGFFFYHYFVAIGLFPAFLGGYFGVVSVMLLPALLFFNFKDLLNTKTIIELLFIFILAWSALVAIYNYLFSSHNEFSSDMLVWSISGVLFNLALYLVAKNFIVSFRGAKYYIFILVLMVIVVVGNVGESGIFYIKQEAADDSDSVATYQGFARSLIYILLFLVSLYFRRRNILFVVFALGFVSLFLNGARSELVLFSIAVTSLFLINSFLDSKSVLAMFILAVVVSATVYYFNDMVPNSRMFQLVDISESSSYQARALLTESALRSISDNPLVGEYGGYTYLGGIGSYSHNLLSAWVNLGFIGFLSYILILTFLWLVVFRLFLGGKIYSQEFSFLFLYLVYVTLAFTFSKPHSDMAFGFLVGLYSRLNNKGYSNA